MDSRGLDWKLAIARVNGANNSWRHGRKRTSVDANNQALGECILLHQQIIPSVNLVQA